MGQIESKEEYGRFKFTSILHLIILILILHLKDCERIQKCNTQICNNYTKPL